MLAQDPCPGAVPSMGVSGRQNLVRSIPHSQPSLSVLLFLTVLLPRAIASLTWRAVYVQWVLLQEGKSGCVPTFRAIAGCANCLRSPFPYPT